MSEMVERVARAIRAELGLDWPYAGHAELEEVARSAIRAMRDPTEEMEVAGGLCEPFMTPKGEKYTPGRIISHACYTAMIDAALGVKK